ncbi:hypothetical protein HanRHA438_Chr12g0532841 [Helianthus annuus]|nr:hypothetical protein HanRHA438_Chr12g0532841 [Helianthus annuus]
MADGLSCCLRAFLAMELYTYHRRRPIWASAMVLGNLTFCFSHFLSPVDPFRVPVARFSLR